MTKPTRAEKREQKKRKEREMKVSGASVKKLRKLQLGGADPSASLGTGSSGRGADRR